MLQLFGFTQFICTPTRITNDTESMTDIKGTVIIPSDIVDQELTECVRKLNHTKFPEKTITCRDYRSYDPTKRSEDLSEVDWDLICNCHGVNFAWSILKNILSTVFNKSAPVNTKRVRGKFSSWLSANIKPHMNTSNKLMRKARKSKINAHREEYKWKRNEVNIMIRKAKPDYTRTLLS